jgi:hypothetical protein
MKTRAALERQWQPWPAAFIYLVGGAPRVAGRRRRRLLQTECMPRLQTDVVRTVRCRVLPELNAIDQVPVEVAGSPSSCMGTLGRRPKWATREPNGFSSRGLRYQRHTHVFRRLEGVDSGLFPCKLHFLADLVAPIAAHSQATRARYRVGSSTQLAVN